MSSYSVQILQNKLARLSMSQDSIETLSLWIIHHKSKAKTSVSTWLEEFQNGDAEKKLVLLYLANDILQNGRRRGADVFLDIYKDILRVAIPLVRGHKVQSSVERVLKIWKDRKVYDNPFLRELGMILEPTKKQQTDTAGEKPVEFKLSLLDDALTELRKFEAELKVKSSHLTHLRVDVTNPLSSLEQLKDKADGGRVSLEFGEASQKLQDYCECLGIEVNERINILDMLKDTKAFTTYKLNEFRRTVQNYKELGSRVDSLKDKLEHHSKDLERAQSTATSDPTAEEDITVVGDMEIESDTESQDEQTSPQEQQPVAQPPVLVTTKPQGLSVVITTPQQSLITQSGTQQNRFQQAPPPSYYPQSANINRPPFGPTSLPTPRGAPPPARPRFPPPQKAPLFPSQSTTTFPDVRPPPSRFAPPRVPPLRGNLHPPRHPPRLSTPPLRPRVQIPPPRFPLRESVHPVPMPRDMPSSPPPSMPRAMSAMRVYKEPSKDPVIVRAPVLYKEPQKDDPTSTPPNKDPPSMEDTSPSEDKPSLDDRLNNLKMTNKLFGRTILDQNTTGDISSTDTNFAEDEERNDFEFSDQISPEESSPQLNMDNPILQALFSSPQTKQLSEETTPNDKAPTESVDKVDTNMLEDILETVKTAATQKAEQELKEVLKEEDSSTKNSVQSPASIPITPTLTNLLDKLLPSLSKSLQMERKRKQEDKKEPESPNKVPRINSEQGPGALPSKPWLTGQEPPPHYPPPPRQQYPRQRHPRPDYQGQPSPHRYGMRPPPRPRGHPRFSGPRPPRPNYYRDDYRSEFDRGPTNYPPEPRRDYRQGPAEAGGPYRPDFNRRSSYH